MPRKKMSSECDVGCKRILTSRVFQGRFYGNAIHFCRAAIVMWYEKLSLLLEQWRLNSGLAEVSYAARKRNQLSERMALFGSFTFPLA